MAALLQDAAMKVPNLLKKASIADPVFLDPIETDTLFMQIGTALWR